MNYLLDEVKKETYTYKINLLGCAEHNPEFDIVFKDDEFYVVNFNGKDFGNNRNFWQIQKAIAEKIEEIEARYQKDGVGHE